MNPNKSKRRTRATRSIWAAAYRMTAAGITVYIDSRYPTVCISAPDEDDIFMQGDDADSFIEECEALWKHFPSLPMDICELAIAEPYTEFWN